MNQRLNLNIPQNNTFLLPRDILAAADRLIGMKFGMGTLDDMNHLKNKRIRSVADLLQDQFGLALVRLENVVRGTICGAIRHKLIPTPQNLVTSTPLTTTYESFFGLHPLSQVLDRTNPLTQIVHGRKLSYLGPGGLTGRTANFRIRDIHPSHYGRICPIDTSEGINVGLIGSLAIHARIVPLSRSEKCIVGTGLERQVALDSGVPAIADHEGKIISTDTDKIILSGNGDALGIPLGQILADGAATVGGELALGKNVLVAYMPWEGYNFEDAVLISERLVYEDIYTSFHIRKYEIQTHVTSQGPERITNEIPHLEAHLLRNLDKNGIVMLGSWVETGDILVGKLTPQVAKESSYAPEDRLLRAILGIQVSTSKETCLKLPIGGRGRVIDVRWVQKKGGSSYNPETIRVYISQKREIKVGDKVAGRHGNKGIISKILPRQDMPYLQDGRPVDMVFNPLGVPSRMNVGQLFECSLGLAGSLLDRHYRIAPFDERYEQEASRKLVFSELYQATRQEVLGTTIIGGTIPKPEDAPESFRLLVRELRSLALELNHFLVSEKNFQINRKEA
ncbi:RpoB [Gossypium australe]|uniref:DNA-directed RNA polymerase n=1 Tax=Gossypium australe TaxID=47621 RepID=A0A5B6TMB1_9ROSI|nr:RpoB [Gossypium australe]